MEILVCDNNLIEQLDNLPPTLKKLYFSWNIITHLNKLPQTLEKLDCSWNYITHLDNLPQTLKILYCFNNPLKYNFAHTLENIRNYVNINVNKIPT